MIPQKLFLFLLVELNVAKEKLAESLESNILYVFLSFRALHFFPTEMTIKHYFAYHSPFFIDNKSNESWYSMKTF